MKEKALLTRAECLLIETLQEIFSRILMPAAFSILAKTYASIVKLAHLTLKCVFFKVRWNFDLKSTINSVSYLKNICFLMSTVYFTLNCNQRAENTLKLHAN